MEFLAFPSAEANARRTPRRRYDGKVPLGDRPLMDKLCDIIDFGRIGPRWLKRLRSIRRDVVANGRFSESQAALVISWGKYRPKRYGEDSND